MLEQVKSISEIDGVTALEAAIVAPQGRNHIFSALDLATLGVLASLSAKPMLDEDPEEDGRQGRPQRHEVWACAG